VCNRTIIADLWEGLNIYDSFWRVYLNKSDGASIELPGEGVIPLKRETLYFIPAWVRFITHTCRPVDHFYIHFDLIGLNNTVIKEVFNTLIPCRERVRFGDIVRLQEAGESGLSRTCRIQALIFERLGEIFASLPEESLRRLDQATILQNRFSEELQYIDNHLSEELNNSVLARQTHMSLSHFVRMFRSAIGQSPAEYVVHRRISRAAEDLLFTKAKIDEIASQCGFANRFHFSRQFKKVMGFTPAAYRSAYRLQIAEGKERPAIEE
jgi:AraC-like DNA-binding protein